MTATGQLRFVGVVRHIDTRQPIIYPKPEAEPDRSIPYDLIFTAYGEWIYSSSMKALNTPVLHKAKKAIAEKGEFWVILDSTSGELIDSNYSATLMPDALKSSIRVA
jgi:hypothetical protein